MYLCLFSSYSRRLVPVHKSLPIYFTGTYASPHASAHASAQW